jgi:S-formylglutathione hydrolase FrmB
MTAQSLAAEVSLTHGWLPLAVQAVAGLVLVWAVWRRPIRWSRRWLPAAVLAGLAVTLVIRWYIGDQGWSDNPAPPGFWVWIALTGAAAVVALAGWRGTSWRKRVASVLAAALSLLCVALSLNLWTGYLPTTASAWGRLVGTPLGGEIDLATFQDMREKGVKPLNGTVLSVYIPSDASGFKHRNEIVYLPPAWYSSNPPSRLPVVMMIGGEFGHPGDWPSVGAREVLDDFAARHGGNAPVVVWVDQSGTFNNDTECVNGVRGNAADHLTKDVVPYMISTFGVSSDPAHWGIAGWSAGGTCALTLTAKYPNLFSAFVDIDGQRGANAGTEQQTVHRLFDGDRGAWAAFDPQTVMAAHGPYSGVSGWFAVSQPTTQVYRAGSAGHGQAAVSRPDPSDTGGVAGAAQYMCAVASSHGIECAVVSQPGEHDFPHAVSLFRSALPWLAGKLGTPGTQPVPLPGA